MTYASVNTSMNTSVDTTSDGSAKRREPCKGCSASVQVDEQQLERIIRALSANPEQCVDDDTYAKRMSICEACPSLIYDTTCKHCGCLVAVRAKLKDRSCPYPGQAKW